jgi:hypothetical protein
MLRRLLFVFDVFLEHVRFQFSKYVFVAADNRKCKANSVTNLLVGLCGVVWVVCDVEHRVRGCCTVKLFSLTYFREVKRYENIFRC